jgi:ketosteroid isomerase-like protein
MTTQAIADDFAALCRAGKFEEAGEKYWADGVVSLEAAQAMPKTSGKAAARAKGEGWAAANEIHSMEVGPPYVHGDQFVVRFTVDQTRRATGERVQMDEVGVYTLKDGKIVEERFFYAT